MMSNSKELTGKTALITGCNRGIGFEILKLFSRKGANIIACIRQGSEEFSSMIKSLMVECSNEITLLYFDLEDENSIKDAMKWLFKNKIEIDILVNNAGVATGELLQMTTMSELRRVFQINFFSHVLITQYVVKILSKRKGGSIINIGSIAGLDSNPGYTSYGSSKAALMFFTKTIAKELTSQEIRVNAIAPSLTDTEMANQMKNKAREEMIYSSSFKRLAKPLEIAELALFLASDRSSFINGQIIRIDGCI